MKKLMAFLKDEDGLETSEYALMGALIVIGLVVAVQTLEGAIEGTLSDMTSAINTR